MRNGTSLTAAVTGFAVLLTFTSCRSVDSVEEGILTSPPVSLEQPALGTGPPQEEGTGSEAATTESEGTPAEPVLTDVTNAPPPDPEQRIPEYYPNIYRPFAFSVGGAAYGNFDTSVRLSTPVLVGVSLDLEDFLGVDSSSQVLRFDTHYAFNKRHRIDAAFYDIGRSGTAGLDEDLEVGDVIIPAGNVETKFDTSIFKLAYRYNFVADYRTTIGASIGFHTMRIDLGIQTSGGGVEETFKATAPLPLIGLHGAYALSEHWALKGGFEFLQVQIGEFEGFIGDTLLSIENTPFKHFAWGVAYNGFNLDMKIEDSPLAADIEYGYQGLLLYIGTWF